VIRRTMGAGSSIRISEWLMDGTYARSRPGRHQGDSFSAW
jgi:hypothetical protein